MSSQGSRSSLPPPPPLPSTDRSIVKHRVDQIIRRRGVGTSGRRISLLANHFKVSVNRVDEVFYQYHVTISSEDKKMVENKEINRKIIDQLYKTYSSELAGKRLAYDGEKCLYTVGPLPCNKLEFSVVLEESFVNRGTMSDHGSPIGSSSKRTKQSFRSKTFTVGLSYAANVPLRSMSHDALRVLDIILRQQSANRGCLLVRQSFFQDDFRNFADIGGGIVGCRGLYSSFISTQGGLTLNMDVSTTVIITPGPVIDFLLKNQSVRDAHQINWEKAKKVLKFMKVKALHNNIRYKIQGFSEKPCNQLYFPLKLGEDDEPINISVYDYYTKHRKVPLTYSAYLPCLDVGKSNRPTYLPLELCSLDALQRYKKALTPTQRASLVEKSRQKPQERIRVITNAIKDNRYEEDPLMEACGVSIDKRLTQLDGRVLEAPMLIIGQNEECIPCNGRWNFNKRHLHNPVNIEKWAVVCFSARSDLTTVSRELINCAKFKGMNIEWPIALIYEDEASKRLNPFIRVEKMFDLIMAKTPSDIQFILCVIPDRKTSELYGPWKRKCLCAFGIPNQCIAPVKMNDQYLSNVLLKINTKVGGINSLLSIEQTSRISFIHDIPTMILGMDVSHGSPGSDIPSIAAVVGSLHFPLISRYRAAMRTQPSKAEMIECLYKPLENGGDGGMMRELLLDFYKTSKNRKPAQIIVFRDGVGESQFSTVLKMELDQMKKAYQALGDGDLPKFTFIVAQKNHHTKLFLANNAEKNVPPGTVVDTGIVHPHNYDFFMCSHVGIIGTSRPVHYHVLLDNIGFEPDKLQQLIHALSYTNQRSTTATSIVAPIFYAHLAAAQMSQFVKFEDGSGNVTKDETIDIQQLPKLHDKIVKSMFFC
ncbi:protein argonaute 16-like [Impatiens glandulifera]|uniref:protein argonaute 16-like n=1 Tax=Impatiens glandulifera TaxID=253017 RepID=UPI001FB12F76|nr:protein argonaute 16-like [Impatiens glandulifera]XP_047342708.1 protein argonaute 16-like [Impatiens glandulifera]